MGYSVSLITALQWHSAINSDVWRVWQSRVNQSINNDFFRWPK